LTPHVKHGTTVSRLHRRHWRRNDVEQVVSVTAESQKLDPRNGGGAAVDAARGFYGYAWRMIHSTADQRTHRDLKMSPQTSAAC
jgi:hypothetical protein